MVTLFLALPIESIEYRAGAALVLQETLTWISTADTLRSPRMQVTMATPHTSVPPPPPPSSLSSSPYSPLAIHDVVSSPDVNLSTVGKIVDADLSCLKSVNLVSGLTPLQAAAGRTHSRLIRLLVARGADLEDRGQRGETPFLIACQVGQPVC